jgi:hypothetical protein
MINPAGMDIIRWKEMGIDEGFYRKQMRIINTLVRLGAEKSLTCTPYYFDPPSFGDHLAWAESNAVVYANSLIGARTNRESGISALASGIIGKTPNYGLHIQENREPTLIVDVEFEIKNEAEASILGYISGEKVAGEVPYFRFKNTLPESWLKLMGASLAAKGNTALFHVEEQTPEWNKFSISGLEKIEVDIVEIKTDECEPDLIALGCPHLSEQELENLYEVVKDRGKVKREFWVFLSRKLIEKRKSIVEKIEEHGIKVFSDTCMVVSPATESYECVMVNSGKALQYLPKLRRVQVKIGSMKECVEEAFKV